MVAKPTSFSLRLQSESCYIQARRTISFIHANLWKVIQKEKSYKNSISRVCINVWDAPKRLFFINVDLLKCVRYSKRNFFSLLCEKSTYLWVFFFYKCASNSKWTVKIDRNKTLAFNSNIMYCCFICVHRIKCNIYNICLPSKLNVKEYSRWLKSDSY